MNKTLLAVASLGLVANAQLDAQQPIPVRQLTPAIATDSGLIRELGNVRPLSDGRVMVNDRSSRRIVLFDSTLKKMTILADTTHGAPAAYEPGNRAASIIPYIGDSTLYVDYTSQAFIVIDPSGKFGRIMSPPKVSDLSYMASTGSGFDLKGRLVYRGYRRPPPNVAPPALASPTNGGIRILPPGPDSAPILRIDFETREVDTIGMMKIANPRTASQTVQGSTPGSMSIRMSMVFNPLPQTDEWALMPDGTVAIVRGQDYHVDWIGVDDAKRASAKMPFAWKRITLEEKRQIIDSIKAARAASDAKAAATLPPAPQPGVVVFQPLPLQIVEPAELPDYYPSVRAGQVKADLEGNLWVLPATGTAGVPTSGLVFDIVNRNGEIFERVQLPPGRNLVGFGRGGVIYMSPSAPFLPPTGPSTTTLERAVVLRPAAGTIKP